MVQRNTSDPSRRAPPRSRRRPRITARRITFWSAKPRGRAWTTGARTSAPPPGRSPSPSPGDSARHPAAHVHVCEPLPILPRPLHIAARIVLASAGSYWVSALAAGTVPLYAGGATNAVYGGTLLGITLLPLVFLWALAARRLRTVFCALSLSVLLLSAAGGLAHG